MREVKQILLIFTLIVGFYCIADSLAEKSDSTNYDEIEILRQESINERNRIRLRLPQLIEDVKSWIKENKYPPYQDYIFSDLAKVDEDIRVLELYCEVIKKSNDLRAKLSALRGIQHINDKSTITVLKKALSDEYIFVRQLSADILFEWGEKDYVYATYKNILSDKRLEIQLNKEIPDVLKFRGFYGKKSNPQWYLYSTGAKASLFISILQRTLSYDKSEIQGLIEKIVKEGKLISIIEKSIRLDSEELNKRKKEYPNWLGYKTQEGFIKSKKDLIEKLHSFVNEGK